MLDTGIEISGIREGTKLKKGVQLNEEYLTE